MTTRIDRTEAAVLWGVGEPWQIEEVELAPPGPGQVVVALAASGICHSDEHLVRGDLPGELPAIGGHEGAGVVVEVGAEVRSLAVGDHVVFSFIPVCGRCRACSTGHQNLCEIGGVLFSSDGGTTHTIGGRRVRPLGLLGTFARHTVAFEHSCVRIDPAIPLDRACLLGCGFVTGWGAAVHRAQVRPGDNVLVAGIGGIGASAVLGAVRAGAEQVWAVDPVAHKRNEARRLGATHTAASLHEALEAVREATWNRGIDKVILAIGVGDGQLLEAARKLTAKRGRIVVVNIHPPAEHDVRLSLHDLTVYEQEVVGCLYGSANPRADIPRLLELFSQGHIDLDSLVTRTYALDDINDGFEDLRAARNLRGVLVYD